MLAQGLPPGSAVTRNGKLWTPDQEFAALAVERADLWGQRLAVALGWKPGALPAALTFSHPDRVEMRPPRPKIETDPDKIRRWFAKAGR